LQVLDIRPGLEDWPEFAYFFKKLMFFFSFTLLIFTIFLLLVLFGLLLEPITQDLDLFYPSFFFASEFFNSNHCKAWVTNLVITKLLLV